MHDPAPTAEARTSLRELALLFLRLGMTAFGGPAAHIAMMQEEVVRRRAWLSEERFLDLISATNLIPGPNSTELAIHIGWARRGLMGLVVAGFCFIVPATLITAGLGWGYVTYGALPRTTAFLCGVKPVIVAVVLQAILTLLPKAAPTHALRLLVVLAAALSLSGVDELLVLFGAGILTSAGRAVRAGAKPLLWFALPSAVALKVPVSSSALFWVFLKIGSVLFGSGYVLIAFLRADLVQRLGWLTEAQLLDAVAVGQVTPGPVFTTATFIGYLLSGPAGALAASAGIFLPAFVFVLLSAPFVAQLRASATSARLLDGLNAASLALMLVATCELTRTSLTNWPAALIFAVSSVLLIRFRVSSTWLVLLGGLVGLGLG